MLPVTVVTLTTFLLEICSSSPVYNMQPAHITANIGTMGRNIRNLPCISRKTNQSGVCMFAIDCLKANGTHLGTCIDRFYFGSCCRIEPLNEVIDNSIESIIPSRVPPHRITATATATTPISTTVRTTKLPQKIETTAKRKPTTQTTTVSTTTERIELLTKNEVRVPTTSLTTTTKKIPTVVSQSVTEYPQKLSTFQSVVGNVANLANDITVSTAKPKTTTKTTKAPQKPVTTKSTTPIPSKTTQQKTKPTVKPFVQNSTKPTVVKSTIKPVSKPTYKPKPQRPGSTTQKPPKITKPSTTKPPVKPLKNTTKPVRITTRKPTTITRVPTLPENSTIKVTRKPVTTTKLPVKVTTLSPIFTTGAEKISPITTTQKTVDGTNATLPTFSNASHTSNFTTTTEMTTMKVNVTNVPANVSDSFENNEIESEKANVTELFDTTTKGSLITWAVIDDKNTTTSKPINGTSEESDEWVPVTTPDGWVLLPSLPVSSSTPRINVTLATSTERPMTTISTSSAPMMMNTTSPATTIANIFNISVETTSQFSTPPPNVTVEHVNVSTEATTTTATTSQIAQHDKPVNMSDFTDVCGRRMYPEARIVGGEKSSFGKWPWQISLRQWRTSTYLHKCGAALLNENWAITAAHCVDNVPPSDLLLRLGEHDLSTEAEPYLHQERRVQIVASHPQFDPRTFEYDLALLRFYEPVTFQPNIIPVCVPQTDENFVGRTAHVTGWGRLYEDGPLPSILQEVSVPVINNTVCESMYRAAGYIEHIPHIFICAGWRRGGFDSCEGDSGGPMVIQRPDKRFLLAGIISWGIGCAEPNQPGVYTRISEFRDWINQILQF